MATMHVANPTNLPGNPTTSIGFTVNIDDVFEIQAPAHRSIMLCFLSPTQPPFGPNNRMVHVPVGGLRNLGQPIAPGEYPYIIYVVEDNAIASDQNGLMAPTPPPVIIVDDPDSGDPLPPIPGGG